MNLKMKKCLACGGTAFAQSGSHFRLTFSEKSFTKGLETNYTVCTTCGEVLSIKILHPGKNRHKK
ncbi:hypothetical protein [Neobacillus niacini]|uniref:hypothetical protein n=1 Tax=Neobacillus niacini TaxID=86668 RepID=UPI003983BACB